MGLTYVSRGFIPCRTLATCRARSQSRLYRRSARCRWPEAAADASNRIDEHSAVVASPCSTTIECPSCKASSAASVFCASFELRKISFQPGPESCPRHVRDVTPPSCADAAVTAAESFTQSPRKSMPSRLSGPLTVPAARTWCRRAAQRTSTHSSIRISRCGLLRSIPRKITARAACLGARVDTSIIAHNSRCILLRGALEALENMRADRCSTQTKHWRGWRHALNSINLGMTQEFTLLHINSSLELWSYWSSRYCPADLISLIKQHLSSTLAAP